MFPTSVTNYVNSESMPNHLVIMALLMGELGDNHIDFQTKIKNLNFNSPAKRPNAFGRNNKDAHSEKE